MEKAASEGSKTVWVPMVDPRSSSSCTPYMR
jgi:hypothetical protein